MSDPTPDEPTSEAEDVGTNVGAAPQRRGRPALKAAALVGVAAVAIGGLVLIATSRGNGVSQPAEAAESVCVPVVMVVRHAEDANGPEPRLTTGGKLHASLYPEMFESYMSEAHSIGAGGVDAMPCPVGRVIAINPNKNDDNVNPSTNPYNTILPYATAADITVEVVDPDGVPYTGSYVWNTDRRKALLDNADFSGDEEPTSTIVAWNKAGLNPTAAEAEELKKYNKSAATYTAEDGLLKKLPTTFTFEANGDHYTPPRNHFWVFAQQDPTTGTFAIAKRYEQQYSKDGTNWYVQPILPDTDKPTSLRVGPTV
jgi:hypothetical protein